MGIAAVVASNMSIAGTLSPFPIPGGVAAGPVITSILVFLLAYLNVVEASEQDRQEIRVLLVLVVVPLAFVFAAIIVYESLTILGLV